MKTLLTLFYFIALDLKGLKGRRLPFLFPNLEGRHTLDASGPRNLSTHATFELPFLSFPIWLVFPCPTDSEKLLVAG